MMPQKLNPDVAEARARPAPARRSAGSPDSSPPVKGLPLSYNSDLAEDKQAVFRAHRDVRLALPALTVLVRDLEARPRPPRRGGSRPAAPRHRRGRGSRPRRRPLPRRARAGRRCRARRRIADRLPDRRFAPRQAPGASPTRSAPPAPASSPAGSQAAATVTSQRRIVLSRTESQIAAATRASPEMVRTSALGSNAVIPTHRHRPPVASTAPGRARRRGRGARLRRDQSELPRGVREEAHERGHDGDRAEQVRPERAPAVARGSRGPHRLRSRPRRPRARPLPRPAPRSPSRARTPASPVQRRDADEQRQRREQQRAPEPQRQQRRSGHRGGLDRDPPAREPAGEHGRLVVPEMEAHAGQPEGAHAAAGT